MSTAIATARIIEARWLLPIARPAIADGAVLLDERGVVRAVGPRARVRADAPSGTPRVFAGEVVLPAFANAHLHLELSALGGLPSGQGLVAWVRALLEARPRLEATEIARGIERAVRELVTAGTAFLGDVTSGLAPLPADAPFEGVRFHEALAADPARARAALDDARVRAGNDPGPLTASLAAHAPATCSEELLALVAREQGPLSIHLAEDPAERTLLDRGEGAWAELLRERKLPVIARGASPVTVAMRAGLLAPRTLAVHCVDLDDEDVATLARSGATAVLCPRSNRFLGLPRAPIEKLIAANVPLAFGTDSLASSPSLNVREELPALPLDPVRALEAATLGGARALGLAHRGSIVEGSRPVLIALDVVVGRQRPETAVVEQPRAEVLWC